MSPKLTKASRKRIQSQNAAYARETKRARLGDSAAVPALPEHVERYLDLIRRPANEQRDDADISPSLYIVEDDEYVDEDDEYEPGADQSDSSSEDQSNSPSEDSVTPQRRTGGARPSDGHGSSLGSSRRDRPARAERRDEPCLGCTNSALAGRSTGECFNTVGNGSRCWRCASGHSCYALPKDVVRWAKSLVVARIADNREEIDNYSRVVRVMLRDLSLDTEGDHESEAEASSGRVTNGRSTSGRATNGRATAGKATNGRATAGKATAGRATAGKASSGKASSGKAGGGRPRAAQATVNKVDKISKEMAKIMLASLSQLVSAASK